MANSMSEKAFTDLVLELLRVNGWKAAHFHDSRRQVRPGVFVGDKDAAGFPDIFAVRGKRSLALELKVGSNKPTQKQWAWLEALAEAGIETHVLRPRDLEDFKRTISRRAA